MKNHPIVLSVILLLLVSCDTSYMYKSAGELEEIRQKTTIKTFEHLNEPIVIALPVYENYYLFGNKNSVSREKRAGDIIAVIDIETDTVYDWVFFPGEHGWSIWRLVEAGSNPTRYLMSSVGTESVATLEPSKTELTITKTGIHDNFWNYKAYGNKVPLCYITRDVENNVWDYHTQLFDSATNTLSEKDLCVKTSEAGFVQYLRSDYDGNLWISYPHSDGNVYIQEMDINSEMLSEPFIKFSHNNYEKAHNVYCISNDYIFVGSYPYGSDLYGTWLYLVNRKTKETREISFSGNKYPQFILDVQEVNGQFYAIVLNAMGEDIPDGINIYKINLDSYSSQFESYISYDMTENTYVRGNCIYFMCSRDTADITYTYYDTEKKEQGPIIPVSVDQIVAAYLNN